MRLGERLALSLRADDVVVLGGGLGAGKTQFAKGVAKGLGVDDEVTSPTFNILVQHVGDELPLLHFDLYRLNDEGDLEDVDFFGLIESGGASLVEWGSKFPQAMPDERLDVNIAVAEDGSRDVTVTGQGGRGCELEREFELSLVLG